MGFYHPLGYHPGSLILSITLSYVHLSSEGKPLNPISQEGLRKHSNV